MDEKYTCSICNRQLESHETYEYRGEFSCDVHFDEMAALRDNQRNQVISEEHSKTNVFKGLDFSSKTVIGRANRELLSSQIEVASKESQRLKEYEKRS